MEKNKKLKVAKTWGMEYWITNDKDANYCMKLLLCRYKEWSSNGLYHYHKIKDETFLVVHGLLELEIEQYGLFHFINLGLYDSYRVKPGVKHRFCAATTRCRFVEASTYHDANDSFRCRWDAVKKLCVDVVPVERTKI